MQYHWNWTRKIAEKLNVDEVKLFVVISAIECACLFLVGYLIVAYALGWEVNATMGVGGLCTILSGGVIGLFGSVFWMIRNER